MSDKNDRASATVVEPLKATPNNGAAVGAAKPKQRKTKTKKLENAKGGKRGPWNFPKNTLEEAIKIAQAIEEKNAGKPLDAPVLVKYVGFKKSNDWRFLDLLQSGNRYGLIAGSGIKATISLEKIGESIVAPSSPAQRQQALSQAFDNVELFKKVAEFYKGKTIPEDEYFANTLSREFEVPRERVEHFIRVFTSNLTYIKAFAASSEGRPILKPYSAKTEPATQQQPADGGAEVSQTGVREFLDTCFVLMPFGGWNDKYYEQVYRPAIKEAGFEPMRADDLFHTGAVIEQIWEQVRKAKVLLAELTGKNANVFYELGLSHASGKPVVFIASTIEDVPADLRHLRVILYDIREPDWSGKLRKDITVYLKNAKADPAKSIPSTFRKSTVNDEGEAEGEE